MQNGVWNCDFAGVDLFQDVAYALSPLLFGERLSQISWRNWRDSDWPSLADYQTYMDRFVNPLEVGMVSKLSIVGQDAKPKSFDASYLSRIYHLGEIQTRTNNWHDLMQILSWRLFPQSKASLVRRHYQAARQRWLQLDDNDITLDPANNRGRRSAEENLLSLWDEGGLVLLTDDETLAIAIRQFDWRQLFVAQRSRLATHLRMLVFGHALMDKLRNPYIGLTANAVILPTPSSWLSLPTQQLLPRVDRQLAQLFQVENGTALRDESLLRQLLPTPATQTSFTQLLCHPHDLQPFPLLGMPGLWPGNDAAAFYSNTGYFRPGRRQTLQKPQP